MQDITITVITELKTECVVFRLLTIHGHLPWTLVKPPVTRASLPKAPPGTANTGFTSGNAWRSTWADISSASTTGSERPHTVRTDSDRSVGPPQSVTAAVSSPHVRFVHPTTMHARAHLQTCRTTWVGALMTGYSHVLPVSHCGSIKYNSLPQ